MKEMKTNIDNGVYELTGGFCDSWIEKCSAGMA